MNEIGSSSVSTKEELPGDMQRPLFADLDSLLDDDLAPVTPTDDALVNPPRLTLVHGDAEESDEEEALVESAMFDESEVTTTDECAADDALIAGDCEPAALDDDEAMDDDESFLDDDEPDAVEQDDSENETLAFNETFCSGLDEAMLNESSGTPISQGTAAAAITIASHGHDSHDESDGLLELVTSHCDSHSAGIDISIASEPVNVGVRASAAAVAAECRPSQLPKRIGEGQLIPAKLTWRPSDLFGGAAERRGESFKWEVMLTTACVTAACGMVGIWLLRTVLA